MEKILQRVLHELEHHIPFTLFGAFTGIIIMLIIIYGNFLNQINLISENIFFILHPIHIFLSAQKTTGLGHLLQASLNSQVLLRN